MQKGLGVEIDHQSRIDGFSIYPDFKMYVVGGGPACFAGNRNRCTCFHMIARTDQVFGIMGVYRFQAVVMTHDDYVAITPAPTVILTIPSKAARTVSRRLIFRSMPV